VWEEEEENGVQVRADSIVRVVSSIPESKCNKQILKHDRGRCRGGVSVRRSVATCSSGKRLLPFQSRSSFLSEATATQPPVLRHGVSIARQCSWGAARIAHTCCGHSHQSRPMGMTPTTSSSPTPGFSRSHAERAGANTLGRMPAMRNPIILEAISHMLAH
jgi:hypothetical protein